jgi:hypothetical protein
VSGVTAFYYAAGWTALSILAGLAWCLLCYLARRR